MGNIPATKRWKGLIEQAAEIIANTQEEMQEWVDERSEEWQESEKACTWQERIDALEEACSALQEVEYW